MTSTYRSLRNEGMHFPPEEQISAAFVDTAVAPDWTDSDVCMRCRTAFTFTNRKHHCRNCGNVFCNTCSSTTSVLPHLGINEPVRVCTGCWEKKNRFEQLQPQQKVKPHSTPNYSSSQTKKPRQPVADAEDLDLKRALELSLAESTKQTTVSAVRKEVAPKQAATEEDDADLKAAIEASLRETAPSQAQEAYQYPKLDMPSSSTPRQDIVPVPVPSQQQQQVQMTRPVTNPYEIQQTEQENIRLFASLVDHLKTDPHGTILRDPKVQELHESISSLRPKLARSLGDTIGKYESLIETHAKLATVVKYYDRMLEARLASTYSRGQYGPPHTEPRGQPSDPYSTSGAPWQQQQPSKPYEGTQNTYGGPMQGQSGYPVAEDNSYYQVQQPHSGDQLYNSTHDAAEVYSTRAEPEQAGESVQPKEEISLIDL